MKRILLSLTCVMAASTGFAQQALSWGKAPLASPVVNADNTVTFNIVAPEAQKVEITGDFLPVKKVKTAYGEQETPGVEQLKKNEKGVWSYTSSALSPELYTYNLIVDGVKITDPLNVYAVRDIASMFNIFMIGGGVKGLYQVKNVPHGTVELGIATQILDNLIAEGKAEPMIVVMTNGNISQEAAPGETSEGFKTPTMMLPKTMDGNFETAFPDVIKFIEHTYRVQSDKNHRAIAGLSMGGFHSLYISINNPDTFGYVGLFSAAVDKQQSGGVISVYENRNQKIDKLFSKSPKLFWIGIGSTDFLYQSNVDLRKYLDSKHYKYTYMETEGGHIWRNWRIYLSEFVQKLFK